MNTIAAATGAHFHPAPSMASPANSPPPPTDLGRVTVTGHHTGSFGGFSGTMFRAMFENPFNSGLGKDTGDNSVEQDPTGPETPPVWFDPNVVVQTSTFYAALPAYAQNALMSSPTLVNQLATFMMQNSGDIQFKSNIDYLGRFINGTPPMIEVHQDLLNALNNGEYLAREGFLSTLAHELGHAMTATSGYVLDASSRSSFIASGLQSEAYAVLNVMLSMHEVSLAGHGQFIVHTGGNASNAYETLYWQFAQDGNLDNLLASIKGHMLGTTYPQYYNDLYDQTYPGGP